MKRKGQGLHYSTKITKQQKVKTSINFLIVEILAHRKGFYCMCQFMCRSGPRGLVLDVAQIRQRGLFVEDAERETATELNKGAWHNDVG